MAKLLTRDTIIKLINSPEDERHDFKQEWYKPDQKLEMVKDILSFVNTLHNEDCYLILGVNDKQEIIGVEEDPNRKNQQNMIDFIRNLPLANAAFPKILVQSIDIDRHKIDIIVIPDTKNVPVYLSSKYPSKGRNKVISPGQIFSRTGDVNTPIDKTTHFYQVESLWKKRFYLDSSIQDQYKYVLRDTLNWSYIEQNENRGFVYNLNPDFFISMEDDDISRHAVEALSIDQIKVRMGWNYLKLNYRNLTIHSVLIVLLDGARHATVVPDLGFIKNNYAQPLSYYSMIENSFEYLVDYMMNSSPNSFTKHESEQSALAKQNIVTYQSEEEKRIVQKNVIKEYPNILDSIKPTSDEIKYYSNKISNEIDKEIEYSESNVKYILKQRNLAQLINEYKTKLLL